MLTSLAACAAPSGSAGSAPAGSTTSSDAGTSIAQGTSLDTSGPADASTGGTDAGEVSGSTGEPLIPIDCTEVCVDTTSDIGIARCHSCRCKAAFDNWLPTRDEVQCRTAEDIVTLTVDTTDADWPLVRADDDATTCANPSLLTGSCVQGSKLGRMQHGDVTLLWICRDPQLDGDGVLTYRDMGLIGQNVRTGATCYWDDVDFVTGDDDMPPLDLEDATQADLARHLEVFYFTDGDGCVGCHDHDPFIYTPYLQSTSWTSVASAKGPYGRVMLDGELASTGNLHLVSPAAAACTTCHRLGNQGTCSYFAPDSTGRAKFSSHEPAIHQASEPGNAHWRLAYWMPGSFLAVADFASWLATFEGARAHVETCCANPGVDAGDCRWAEIDHTATAPQ